MRQQGKALSYTRGCSKGALKRGVTLREAESLASSKRLLLYFLRTLIVTFWYVEVDHRQNFNPEDARYYATTTSGSIFYPARTQKGFVMFWFMTTVRWNLLGKTESRSSRGKFA